MKTFKVLAIDGGGIRGIIPGVFLAEIERLTGQRICELFDLVAGTSTGGILALGLTRPDADGRPKYSANDLVRLYRDRGRDIFHRPRRHVLRSLGGLIGAKYPCHGIEAVLNEYFEDCCLRQALTDVLITSYSLGLRKPFIFRSEEARDKPDYDFLMRDVARATSAAPTFFEPSLVRDTAGTAGYSLVDGGMFSNNPALVAYLEAMKRLSQYRNHKLLLVSLGTGRSSDSQRPIRQGRWSGWGIARWARPSIEILFETSSHTVNYAMHQLNWGDRSGEYFRLQTTLPPHCDSMDDTTPANIEALERCAEQALEKEERMLERLRKVLT